ncbi:MAG: SpaA isopeptide-forming pilin-related protein [Actinomycetales bacterium]|nr:SpaA isopeptide-forming pilin-related protein [Actinomycetales bacterium]
MPALTIAPASAAPVPTLGGFELDGNLINDGSGQDWADLAPGDLNFSTILDTDSSGHDDTTFQSSSKEYDATGTQNGWPNWKYGGGQAAPKSDFGRVAIYTKVVAPGSPGFVNGDAFTYVAFDRDKSSGTDKFAFELNQASQPSGQELNANPVRSQGDIRFIVWDQGGGKITLTPDASNPDVGMYVWDDPNVPNNPLHDPPIHSDYPPGGVDANQNGSWVKITPPSAAFVGAVNTAPVDVPAWWAAGGNPDLDKNGQIPADNFVEFGFDLGAFGALLGCPSQGYSVGNLRSITGTGTTGALVDYVKEQPARIPSECSSLTINKWNADKSAKLAGATFTITPDPTPGTSDTGTSLDVTDGVNTTNAQGIVVGDSDGVANGVITINPAKPGSYTITEKTAPAGYILITGVSEPVTAVALQTTPPVDFVDPLGKISWTKKYGTSPSYSDPAAAGATFQVVRTNTAGAPTLTAAQFTAITGLSTTFTVTDNDTLDLNKTLGQFELGSLPQGTYTITEITPPAGYSLDSSTAVAVVPAQLANVADANAPNVAQKDGADYTFADTRLPVVITVQKIGADTHQPVPGATFDVYKNGTKFATLTTGASGTSTLSVDWGASYYAIETGAPAGYNLPDDPKSNTITLSAQDATDQAADGTLAFVLSVTDPRAGISTQALTPVTLPGNTITDTVTLTGLNANAAGAVTFSLYGPFSSNTLTTVCTGTPVFTATLNVSNPTNGTFTGTSAAYKPTKVGYYYWLASYSGDLNGNRAISGTCGDPTEISEVKPAVGDIVTTAYPTTASQPHLPSAQLYDNVALTGLTADASGTVTFTVYGPYADGVAPNCSVDAPKATFTVNLPTTGDRSSVSLNSYADTAHGTNGYFVPTTVGTYFWKAVYSGDDNNVSRTEVCGSPNEDTKVLKAVTTTTTTSSQVKDEVSAQKLPGVTVGDTATVTGLNTGVAAGGDVTFRLYGPVVDGICPAEALYTSSPVTLHDNGDGTGTASVSGVAVANAGTYYWTATYSGDANNLGSHDGCGEASEKIVVTPATPAISTTATSGQLPGASIHDTATLTGLTPNVDTSKTVTFSLYGPGDLTCSATPVFADTVALSSGTLVGGEWTGTSASYTPTLAGDYHWIASYAGDPNNVAVSGACGDQGETSTITKATTSIVTQATDGAAPLGADPASTTTVSDSATVSGLTADATGTVTFTLYGPVSDGNAANPCLNEKPPSTLNNVYWTSTAIPLSAVSGGSATASTGPVTVSLPADQNLGYFFWVASYSGDDNNLTVSGVCPDLTERSMVTRTGIPHLDKSSPTENTTVLPGDTIHYVVTLSNTGGLPVTSNLVDTLPAGVTPVVGTFSPSVPTINGSTLTWSNVTVDAGQTVVFAYDVTVNADVAAGTLTNTATWAGQSDQTVHTVAPATPSLDKSSPTEFGSTHNASGNVLPGDTIHYVLTLGNTGGAQVTSDLVDTLPSWVTNPRSFEVTTGSYSPAIPSISGSTLTWANVTLGHDQKLVVEFDVTVAADAPAGDLINRATWAEQTDTTKHVVAPGVPTFDKSSPTELGSTQNPTGVVLPGSTIHYVLTLGNTGAAAVTSDLVDTLPTWVSSPSNFTVTHGFVVPATPALSNGGQTLTWPSVTVPHGDSVVIEFDAVVSADAPAGNLVNSATWDEIVDTTTHVVEPGVPGIDKSSPTEKGSEGNPSGVVLPGDPIDYTVSVTNTGGAAVTSDLVDTLPAGVTVVAGSFNTDPTTINGSVLTWTDVRVNAGQTVSFTFQVTVDANVTPGDLRNDATWAGQSDHTIHVVEPGVPHIDKSSPTEKGSVDNPSGNVDAGGTIAYTIKISNTGGSELTSDLVDTLPAGVVPVDGSFSTAPSSFDGTTLVWKSITLAPAATFSVTFQVTVAAGHSAGELVNTATWSGQSDQTVHVVPPGIPGLDKSSPTEQGSVNNPSGNVNPGDTIHYSVLLSNTGGSAITSDLVDTLPAGVTPVAGTFSPSEPTINGSTLTWSNVTVGAQSTVQYTFDVTVDVTAAAGSLVNTATWDEKADTTTHNVVLQPVVAPNPTLVKTADPATGTAVERGGVVTYTVKVGNTGSGPAFGDLVDTLPAGVDAVAGSFTKDGVAIAPDSVTATTITWKNVTVQPGQTITFTYQVTVRSDAVGPNLVNTAKWLGLVSSTSHPLTIPQLPRTGAPFDPVSVALWASLLLALGVMFLVFGRRKDEYEG